MPRPGGPEEAGTTWRKPGVGVSKSSHLSFAVLSNAVLVLALVFDREPVVAGSLIDAIRNLVLTVPGAGYTHDLEWPTLWAGPAGPTQRILNSSALDSLYIIQEEFSE